MLSALLPTDTYGNALCSLTVSIGAPLPASVVA